MHIDTGHTVPDLTDALAASRIDGVRYIGRQYPIRPAPHDPLHGLPVLPGWPVDRPGLSRLVDNFGWRMVVGVPRAAQRWLESGRCQAHVVVLSRFRRTLVTPSRRIFHFVVQWAAFSRLRSPLSVFGLIRGYSLDQRCYTSAFLIKSMPQQNSNGP